jgi:thiamine-phosphate pyrophosphorylase
MVLTMTFPRLYPIIAPSRIGGSVEEVCAFARELVAAGVTILQLRDKGSSSAEILRTARELRRILPDEIKLIMNDRADLALAAQFQGVHLGQDDLPVEAARKVLGPERWIGLSTHNPAQVEAAEATSADYLAIGPVFATISKDNPDPVIGLDGVRQARARTRKPLVAIGGITVRNCRSVIDAGADSVAVISELLRDTRNITAQFMRELR